VPNFVIKLTPIFLTILILGSCSSKTKKNQAKAQLYFGAGTQSLMTQDYTDALSNLLKANELEPNNAEIMNNLGMAYYFKGEKDLAIETLKKSLSLKDNSDAKVNIASIYFNDGDLNSAEKIYSSVLKDLTYDKQARTFYNLGLISVKRSRPDEAEGYFQKSLKEDNSYCPSYYQLGLIKYSVGKFNQSLKNFRNATLGTCYDQPAPHYYQGLSLVGLKQFHEAMMKFDEIDSRFKGTEYAEMARKKIRELQSMQISTKTEKLHESGKTQGSVDF
jgi:type IV pilus assembly protein PilF